MTTIHVPPGEGQNYPMIDGDHVVKAAVHDTGGSFEVFEVTAPASPVVPPHVSPRTGVLFLLEGRVTALVDGTSYDVEPGGVVVFPSGTPCSFEVVGESARFVAVTSGGPGRAVLRRLLRVRAGRPARRGLLRADPLRDPAPRRAAHGSVSPVRFEITTRATPEQVLRAFTDFSERRLETWRRTLDPKTYEVRELGDTWAVARESTAGSPFWVVSRYDWSDPTVVRTSAVETSWGGSGDGTYRILPAAGGGSRLQAEWAHLGVRKPHEKVLIALVNRFPMRAYVARMHAEALDRYAESDRPTLRE